MDLIKLLESQVGEGDEALDNLLTTTKKEIEEGRKEDAKAAELYKKRLRHPFLCNILGRGLFMTARALLRLSYYVSVRHTWAQSKKPIAMFTNSFVQYLKNYAHGKASILNLQVGTPSELAKSLWQNNSLDEDRLRFLEDQGLTIEDVVKDCVSAYKKQKQTEVKGAGKEGYH